MAEYSGLLASKAIKKRQDLLNKALSAEKRAAIAAQRGDSAKAAKLLADARKYRKDARYSAYRASKYGG